MVKAASDKLPVLLLYSQRGSTRVFFKSLCRDRYFLLEVDSFNELLEKLAYTKIAFVVIDEKNTSKLQDTTLQIRRRASLQSLPIFIISSELKVSFEKKMRLSGISDFFREPLEEEFVLETLNKALKQQTLQEKLTPLTRALPPLKNNAPPLSEKKIAHPDQALLKIKETLLAKSSLSVVCAATSIMKKVKEKWGSEGAVELDEKMQVYLRQFLRPQDALIPIAEGKYAYILPATSHQVAQILAETIKDDFKERKFQLAKGSVKLSLSLAIVTLSEDQLKSQTAHESLTKILTTGEAYLEKAREIGQKIVSL